MGLGRNYICVILMGILGTSIAQTASAKSLKIRRLFPLVSVEIPAEGGTGNNDICPRYRDFIKSHSLEQMDMLKNHPDQAEQLSTQVLPIGKEETPARTVVTQVNEVTRVFKIDVEKETGSTGGTTQRVITGQLGKGEAKMVISAFAVGFTDPICKVIVRQNIEAEVIN